MKKKFLSTIALVLALVLCLTLFAACGNNGGGKGDENEYTVSFSVNGGNAVNSVKVAVGDSIEKSPLTSKKNSVFLGWYDNAAFEGNPITFPYTPTANVTLYACWRASTPVPTGLAGKLLAKIDYNTPLAVEIFIDDEKYELTGKFDVNGAIDLDGVAHYDYEVNADDVEYVYIRGDRGYVPVGYSQDFYSIGEWDAAEVLNLLISQGLDCAKILLGNAIAVFGDYDKDKGVITLDFYEIFREYSQDLIVKLNAADGETTVGDFIESTGLLELVESITGDIPVMDVVELMDMLIVGEGLLDMLPTAVPKPAKSETATQYLSRLLSVYSVNTLDEFVVSIVGDEEIDFALAKGALFEGISDIDGVLTEENIVITATLDDDEAIVKVEIKAPDEEIVVNVKYDNVPAIKDFTDYCEVDFEWGDGEHSSNTYLVQKNKTLPSVVPYGAYWDSACTTAQLYGNRDFTGSIVTKVTEDTTLYIKPLDGMIYGWMRDSQSYSVIAMLDKTCTSVVIPSTFNGKPVTSIGRYAFQNCASLVSITIPSSLTSIGNSAFAGCTSLVYNEYDNAQYLGNSTNLYLILIQSKDCSITSCTINESTKLIYNNAFGSCSKLNNIFIPSNVTYIGDSAFSDCSSLASVTVSPSVTSVGGYAFSGCILLRTVTFGSDSQLMSIGISAFKNCSLLGSIAIPAGVTSIGHAAFSGCSSMRTVTFRSSSHLSSISDLTFSGCTSLTIITIPSSVTSIGNGAFSGCTSLGTVTIESGVTTIYSEAFSNCSKLSSITIPASVKNIGNHAFRYCTSLRNVTFESDSQLTNIDNSAFYGCSKLSSITIPASVKNIGNYVFYGCSSLQEVNFDSYNDLIRIGTWTFSACTSLTSIIIPSSVKSMGEYIFYNCPLLTIYCRASSQPSGWHEDWNSGDCPVVWGYTGDQAPIPTE